MSQVISEIAKLEDQIKKTKIPAELSQKAAGMLERLRISLEVGGNLAEFDQVARYIDWIISLPWYTKIDQIIDLGKAAQILDLNHHGLSQIKERILEYLAVLTLRSKAENNLKDRKSSQPKTHSLILFFVGLVGTGKTSLAYSVAEALGRPIVRIPFGGLGGVANLRGQSRVYPDSEPGLIVKALARAKVANPVLLLDEIDRVTEESRGDITGVLVEILDPEQNFAFFDHYIDFPIDLSEVLFVATANNTTNIATAVLDRLEIMTMPSYTDEEKIIIGQKYILPKAIAAAGLNDGQIKIDDQIWPKIVRPLGFDSGMRSLERAISGICAKVARLVIERKETQVKIDSVNLASFLPSW